MAPYSRDPNFTTVDSEAQRDEETHLNSHRQKRALSEAETVHPPGPSPVL